MSTIDLLERANGTADPVAWADELGRQIAEHAEQHDRDGTFVTEAYDLLRTAGYLALAVPTELGGHGATIRDVAMAQRALARHCAADALASTRSPSGSCSTGARPRSAPSTPASTPMSSSTPIPSP